MSRPSRLVHLRGVMYFAFCFAGEGTAGCLTGALRGVALIAEGVTAALAAAAALRRSFAAFVRVISREPPERKVSVGEKEMRNSTSGCRTVRVFAVTVRPNNGRPLAFVSSPAGGTSDEKKATSGADRAANSHTVLLIHVTDCMPPHWQASCALKSFARWKFDLKLIRLRSR